MIGLILRLDVGPIRWTRFTKNSFVSRSRWSSMKSARTCSVFSFLRTSGMFLKIRLFLASMSIVYTAGPSSLHSYYRFLKRDVLLYSQPSGLAPIRRLHRTSCQKEPNVYCRCTKTKIVPLI